jgi:hypothetical protein
MTTQPASRSPTYADPARSSRLTSTQQSCTWVDVVQGAALPGRMHHHAMRRTQEARLGAVERHGCPSLMHPAHLFPSAGGQFEIGPTQRRGRGKGLTSFSFCCIGA